MVPICTYLDEDFGMIDNLLLSIPDCTDLYLDGKCANSLPTHGLVYLLGEEPTGNICKMEAKLGGSLDELCVSLTWS